MIWKFNNDKFDNYLNSARLLRNRIGHRYKQSKIEVWILWNYNLLSFIIKIYSIEELYYNTLMYDKKGYFMWIRTQNKRELVNVIKVEIASNFGDKKNKAAVVGRFVPGGFFTSNTILLGLYSTKEDAIAEIDAIEKCILNNPNGVYTMKSNQ